LLLEFQDEVLQQIKKGKTNSEVEAHRIALEAIGALHFGSIRGDISLISSTRAKSKKPSRLANLIILPKTAAAPGSSKSLETIADPE
jgi:hypothetical protein